MAANFRLSQIDPLPKISKIEVGNTIGQGSFAIVKLAHYQHKKVFAVKFIHRKMCHRHGLSDDDIGKEVMLHKTCSGHPNIIKLLDFGSDRNWLYIAMELAPGGDLFDKIEPDLGVDEEIAHFYFKQLVNAIDFVHSKGVAHRDIKPENILLDGQGNLKIADFGLAAVFRRQSDGSTRLCHTPCGSPPYMAPEIATSKSGYNPEVADIWSCGVVLFVLLTGETPWEEPTTSDIFFRNFLVNDGKILTPPWNKFSPLVLSLVRLILKVTPDKRGKIDQIRKHVWVNQENPLSSDDGQCKNPVLLTSKLLEKMHIGLSDEQYLKNSNDEDKYDSIQDHFISTQPVVDIAAMIDDEDANALDRISASQQVYSDHSKIQLASKQDSEKESIFKFISKDPAIIQFSRNKNAALPASLPQFQFAERLTRFFSVLPVESLIPILLSALNRIGVPTAGFERKRVTESDLNEHPIFISIHTVDRRKSSMRGNIKISKVENLKLKTVEFVKTKGDPLEWRKFFKRITILSREAVHLEDANQ